MDPQLNPYAPPTASVNLTPNAGDDQNFVVASRGARFFGAVLDTLVMMVLISPAVFLSDFARDTSQFYLYALVPWLIYVAVQWTLIATSGQSIGKKLVGTKIVKLDGSDCGFVHGVILRSWIMTALNAIPVLGNLIALFDALWIFGHESRCLHDLIAGTRVIVAPSKG